MGRDSCSKGCEFESRHCILDGHFSHIFVVKIVMMCVWKDENKLKRGRGWPTLKKLSMHTILWTCDRSTFDDSIVGFYCFLTGGKHSEPFDGHLIEHCSKCVNRK